MHTDLQTTVAYDSLLGLLRRLNWIRFVQWVIAAGQMIASARVHFTLCSIWAISTRWVRALGKLDHTFFWSGVSVHVQELGSDNVCGKKHQGSREGVSCKWLQPADKSIAMEHNKLILLLMQLTTKCCCKQEFTWFLFFFFNSPSQINTMVLLKCHFMQSVKSTEQIPGSR